MTDDNRARKYKNHGKDIEELRRRRVGETIQLRKAKREDQSLKKRNIDTNQSQIDDDLTLCDNNNTNPAISLNDIICYLASNDAGLEFQAAQMCRKMLSGKFSLPIDKMIQMGVVPKLVQFLYRHHYPSIQFEACWALTNIASGTTEQTQAVVEADAVPALKGLLLCGQAEVADQAVWALGNIAGNGPETRDLVLASNVMPILLKMVTPETNITLLRNIVWTISNLCRWKSPPPNFELVKPCLPVLAALLHCDDKEVVLDTCWAISYLTDGNNEKIQAVLDTGMIGRLVELLNNKELTILTPALRAVGNVLTGNNAQTDVVINAGALSHLNVLMRHPRLNIVKEATWMVSNITAGNSEQIAKVLDAGIMQPVLNVMQGGDFKSQVEAAWVVMNYTCGATVAQLAKLVEMGALKPMCTLLNSKDTKTIGVVLDGLTNILMAAEKIGEADKVTVLIEECGGLESLEMLQTHDNRKIYEKALLLIEDYFSEDQDFDDLLAPCTNEDGEMRFNVNMLNDVAGDGFAF